ncbi:MAG: carbon-nitrogen hydrolase family protein [Deltaproteobacteria bacterium]|nr:carbon-nitrogen hydrolase family protein [Deltaproteobacteria bacterium]
MEVKLGAIQLECKKDKDDNLRRALALVEQAGKAGVQALTMPDYWYTGLPQKGMNLEDLRGVATTFPGPITDKFAALTKKYGMYIFPGTLLEREGDKVYCSSPLIGPEGEIIGIVRKFHPENAPVKAETSSGVTPATDEYQVFETDIGNLSIMLDMDICAIEQARILALKGADVIFFPAAWGDILENLITIYAQATALYTACVVVIANLAGPVDSCVGPIPCEGGSGIMLFKVHDFEAGKKATVDYVVRAHSYQDDLVHASIDYKWIRKRQQMISDFYPIFRRPETYGLLLDREADQRRHHGKYI